MVSIVKQVNTGKSTIASVREYMMTCPFLDEFARINIDYLGAEPTQYTIDTIPTDPIVKRYTNGDSIRQLVFVFASREYYGAEVLENMANSDFYEKLADWLEQQSRQKNLPMMAEGKKARTIGALTSGYAFATDAHTAQYQIQCKLTYFQEG